VNLTPLDGREMNGCDGDRSTNKLEIRVLFSVEKIGSLRAFRLKKMKNKKNVVNGFCV
jgi:hypothetical protein